jgi:branched-chain amino acid transport system permease protein
VLIGAVAAMGPVYGIGPRTMAEMTTVFIYALVASSLRFLYRYGGQLSVAQGALWGIGSYVSVVLFQKHGMPLWVALPAAMVGSALVAGLIGYPSLRVRGHYFLIITFAFAEMLRISTINLRDLTGGDTGLSVTRRPDVVWPFSVDDRIGWYWSALACLLVTMVVIELLGSTPFGRRLTAVGENEELATSVGINAGATKVAAFMLSGALAGLGGVLWAFNQRFIEPGQFGAFAGINFILMLMLGGVRSSAGVIVGALTVVFLPDWLSLDPTQNEIALGVVLIVIILFLPDGLVASAGQLTRWLLRRVPWNPRPTMVERAPEPM